MHEQMIAIEMKNHIRGLNISRKKLEKLFKMLKDDKYITDTFIITEKLRKDL